MPEADTGALESLARALDRSDAVVVEGRLAVSRLLLAGHRAELVAGTAAHLDQLTAELAQGAAHTLSEACPQIIRTGHAELRDVRGFAFHRGILAVTTRDALASSIERRRVAAHGRTAAVVLARLADPANVGTAIRTARALGVDCVVCDARGADPLGRKAIRASAATCFTQPLWLDAAPEQAIGQLADGQGCTVIALTPGPEATPLSKFVHPERAVYVFGNEGDGLSPELLAAADQRVSVDMRTGVDSLNVAATVAITLWSRRMARGAVDPTPVDPAP